VLIQGRDGNAEAIGDRGDAGEQDLLQADPRDAHAGADFSPEVLKVGFAQSLALLIAEFPAGESGRGAAYGLPETERSQQSNAIGVQRDARADGGPRGAPLDYLRRDPLPMQRDGEREARDSPAHDQDALDVYHRSLQSLPRRRPGIAPYASLLPLS